MTNNNYNNNDAIARRLFSPTSNVFSRAHRSILHASANAAAIGNYPPAARDAETQLPGIYSPKAKSKYIIDFDWLFKGGLRQRIMNALRFIFLGGILDFLRVMRATYGRSIPIKVLDARALEREEGLSKKEFFDKHGFVLLDHKTSMSEEDWIESDRDLNELNNVIFRGTEKDEYKQVMEDFRSADTPAKHIYAKEVEGLIRSVIPSAKEVIAPAKGIRRYPTRFNANRAPAKTVHNDYGINFDEVVNRTTFIDFHPHRAKYEETGANEYMLVNFWRPILPMSEPCRSNPLCFLDGSTLSEDDFVSVDAKEGGITTQLKENPNHKFYYFPDMTTDEVVMFKQFHQVRSEPYGRMPTFHTAFTDPAATKETQGRTSFEYRVGILC